MYDKQFAEKSETGWFEAVKMDYGWQVIEVFRDGSIQKRTVENSKTDARQVLNRLNAGCDIPRVDLGHGITTEHEVM